jgi:hypothetical protein
MARLSVAEEEAGASDPTITADLIAPDCDPFIIVNPFSLTATVHVEIHRGAIG